MNNHRKQTTPLFLPTTNNNEQYRSSSSIFNSFSSPFPSFLPPTPQRRRFDVLPTSTPQPLKSEPTDFVLPPSPLTTTTTTPFHLHSSQKRHRIINNDVVPRSTLARQRRSRLSDKTRCLQKLIPLERQMDTATLYDQTYKYVKFLEAQITLLQSMPLKIIPTTTPTSSTTTHNRHHNNNIDGVEELRRLNRQQLLQVLMSSQVALTVMYTNGWCVFSAEQLAAMLNDRDQQVAAMVEQRYI